MPQALEGDRDENLQHFARKLEGRQLDSSGDILTAVASGSDWVGITLEETAPKRMHAGDNIAMVYPHDGTSSVPDGSALIKGAPHQDNAKRLFGFHRQPRRAAAAPRPVLPPPGTPGCGGGNNLPPLEQSSRVEYDLAWASQNHDAILMTWAFHQGGEEEP